MEQQELATTLSEVGSKITYGGSFLSVTLGFLNTNAAAIGILIALAGLLMNYHFKRKAYNLLDSRTKNRRKGDRTKALKHLDEQ